jgi:hypothetical protein
VTFWLLLLGGLALAATAAFVILAAYQIISSD